MTSSFTPVVPFAGAANSIFSVSASVDSSIEFTELLQNEYKVYELHYSSVISSNSSDDFLLRTSSNNGASFDGGAGNYSLSGWYDGANSGLLTVGGSSSESALSLCQRLPTGNAAGDSLSGILTMYMPSDASAYTLFSVRCTYSSNIAILYWHEYSGVRNSAGIVNALEVYFGGGTITSGEFSLYGYR